MTALQDFVSSSALDQAPDDVVGAALEAVRRHLNMEVAYLSEFVDGQVVFRAVSAPGLEHLAKLGDSYTRSESYCHHVIEGRLPGLIPDTRDEPLAMSLSVTHALAIGSHVSVPIRRADGSAFGMFCCLSSRPNPTLRTRDVAVVELFASMSAKQINASLADRDRHDRIMAATRRAIAEDGFTVAYQPIFNLGTMAPLGFEALCRFRSEPYRTPDVWFAEAAKVGMAAALECAAIDRALAALDHLPGEIYVAINATPDTVASGALGRVLAGRDLSRIVLEVTEQAVVADYDRIAFQLDPFRDEGLRLAVDDAGAGYAGLQQILRLSPDKIKLDMSLTRDIDTDPARRSLARALLAFAGETGAKLLAEGIETPGELATLKALGVVRGQGFLLGRPGSLEAALATVAGQPISRRAL